MAGSRSKDKLSLVTVKLGSRHKSLAYGMLQ